MTRRQFEIAAFAGMGSQYGVFPPWLLQASSPVRPWKLGRYAEINGVWIRFYTSTSQSVLSERCLPSAKFSWGAFLVTKKDAAAEPESADNNLSIPWLKFLGRRASRRLQSKHIMWSQPSRLAGTMCDE
jgi:hypothetical protein